MTSEEMSHRHWDKSECPHAAGNLAPSRGTTVRAATPEKNSDVTCVRESLAQGRHPICSASSRSNGYATATLAPSKGRLIRCTVPGSTPNRLAMTRTPGRPGVARASRIRFSSAGAIGGRPRRLPSLLARASPARTRSAIIARSNSANRPDNLRSLHKFRKVV